MFIFCSQFLQPLIKECSATAVNWDTARTAVSFVFSSLVLEPRGAFFKHSGLELGTSYAQTYEVKLVLSSCPRCLKNASQNAHWFLHLAWYKYSPNTFRAQLSIQTKVNWLLNCLLLAPPLLILSLSSPCVYSVTFLHKATSSSSKTAEEFI